MVRYQHATRRVSSGSAFSRKDVAGEIDAQLAIMEEDGYEFVQAVLLQSAPLEYQLIFKKRVDVPTTERQTVER